MQKDTRQEQQYAQVNSILLLSESTNNPFEILSLPSDSWATLNLDLPLIKRDLKKRLLLIHPDKCNHPRAAEAFEILKTAESDLQDDHKRNIVIQSIIKARTSVFRDLNINVEKKNSVLIGEEVELDQELINKYMNNSKILYQVKLEMRKELKDKQERMNMVKKNEAYEQNKKVEAILQEKRRRAELEAGTEKEREDRIEGWRQFQSKKKKKTTKEDQSFKFV